MNKRNALKLTNYIIAIVLIIAGITFSITSEQITPFVIAFTGSAVSIALYRNITWDYKERKSYFKNSLAEIKKIVCRECGALNPWWSEYCTNCGKELEIEEIECQECHNLNPPKSVYCGVCGAELLKKPEKELKEEKKPQKEITEVKEKEAPKKCPSCGYELNLDVKKCPWCGQNIKTKENEK